MLTTSTDLGQTFLILGVIRPITAARWSSGMSSKSSEFHPDCAIPVSGEVTLISRGDDMETCFVGFELVLNMAAWWLRMLGGFCGIDSWSDEVVDEEVSAESNFLKKMKVK